MQPRDERGTSDSLGWPAQQESANPRDASRLAIQQRSPQRCWGVFGFDDVSGLRLSITHHPRVALVKLGQPWAVLPKPFRLQFSRGEWVDGVETIVGSLEIIGHRGRLRDARRSLRKHKKAGPFGTGF